MDGEKLSDDELLAMEQPAGIYEHYKSTAEYPKQYQFLGLARQTETNELLAVYIPLYHDPAHGGPALQCRPASMFFGDVVEDGQPPFKRFRWVGNGR